MLEPLVDRGQKDRGREQKGDEGDVKDGRPGRPVISKDGAGDIFEQQKGHHTAGHRRDEPGGDDLAHLGPVDRMPSGGDHTKTGHSADNGMGGGDRHPVHGGEMEPEGCRQQGCRHADHQDDGGLLMGDAGHGHEHGRIDDTLADRIGDLGTDQDRAGKFADTRGNNRVADGDRIGTDRVRHGVGHIIGADVPRHVQTEEGRQADDIKIHCALLETGCAGTKKRLRSCPEPLLPIFSRSSPGDSHRHSRPGWQWSRA